MPAAQHTNATIQIHVAVLLFGFTAILGDLIDMSAIMIVWWRVLITSISLWMLIGFGKMLRDLPRQLIIKYAGIGFIIGLHWITFYGAIKLANASVALICMSTTTLFTALIEPLYIRTKVNYTELAISIAIIPAMILIVNHLDISQTNGVISGIVSAFLAAVFSVMNKKYIKEADPIVISYIELSSSWLLISVILLTMNLFGQSMSPFFPPTIYDWVYLVILALLCTTLAQILTLKALKYLSAFELNLVVNLEPVYGILLAIVILKEHKELNPMFYLGAAIIIGSVFLYSYLNKKVIK
ncbi:MAG TPA: DMT family transporter [Saprospiraceae bacterium]|jgi:drug/metabolite transporter (DMT)-like permease|nr:DMT family transporter [Saprospiraceae bacterium]